MKYLGIFESKNAIQNALNDEILLNPYVALYGNNKTLDFNTNTKTSTSSIFSFGGLEVAPGLLYYNGTNYEIKDTWNYDSYSEVYGKNSGSTFFNVTEIGKLFESAQFSKDNYNNGISNILNPLNGWRLPSSTEFLNIIGTSRQGATVNGQSSKHFATIYVANNMDDLIGKFESSEEKSLIAGYLVFPDGITINGQNINTFDIVTYEESSEESVNILSIDQVNNYISQGCIFISISGYYTDGSENPWLYHGQMTYFLTNNGYIIAVQTGVQFLSYQLDNNGEDMLDSFYYPIYLVKDINN